MNCENTLKLWNVNGFEVRLLGNENYLGYKTFDMRTHRIIDEKSFEEDLQRMRKTPEEMIECLENARVIIENNKTSFRKIFDQWSLGDKEIYLIEGIRDLVWDIFNNTTKESSFFSFIRSTIPSSRCHPGTIALIEKIKEECQNDMRRARILVEDFKVVRVLDAKIHNEELSKLSERVSEIEQYSPLKTICAVTTSVTSFFDSGIIGNAAKAYTVLTVAPITCLVMSISVGCNLAYMIVKEGKRIEERDSLIETISQRNLQAPLIIEIEPKITAPSEIDKRVLVSKFTWAVTLVSHGGQPKIPYIESSGHGNHAEIYIEGINDGFFDENWPLIKEAKPVLIGEKFIHLAHYQPTIESGLLSKDDLKYETRTEIWMVTCDKIKMMLQNIELEKTLPKGQRHEYNMLGEGSFVGKEGHNCFTWARYHLKTIGINLIGKEIPPSVTGFAAALVTDYTKKPKKYTETPIQMI